MSTIIVPARRVSPATFCAQCLKTIDADETKFYPTAFRLEAVIWAVGQGEDKTVIKTTDGDFVVDRSFYALIPALRHGTGEL